MSRRKSTTEVQLILPALAVLSQQDDVISSRQLKEGVLKLIKAKKADTELVKNTKQTVIERKIENLISHRTLGAYADYAKIGNKVYIKINGKGKTYLSKTLLDTIEA